MKLLKISSKNSGRLLKKAAEFIEKGKIIVCPTDTVYGLIGDALQKKAIERIFRIKKRPRDKPISIFVKDLKMAKKFAFINKEQEEFLDKVWPGAVTAVLKPKKNLPKEISSGKNKLGVRIPDYKFLLDLIKKLGRPLAESSANISGKPASTEIKEVLKQFKHQKWSERAGRKSLSSWQPSLVIDAGDLKLANPSANPSAVIDLTVWPPKILRY